MTPSELAVAACRAPARRTRARFGPALEFLEGRALLATLSIAAPGGIAGFIQTPGESAKGSEEFSDHHPTLDLTLNSSFLEEMHNRGLMRTTTAAAAA